MRQGKLSRDFVSSFIAKTLRVGKKKFKPILIHQINPNSLLRYRTEVGIMTAKITITSFLRHIRFDQSNYLYTLFLIT